ncbi:MAG: hypothetical protein D6705_17990 [Deltaproteobacteria bacterium]|nr:MAG: hypothetical protein D6705_17990 [Deltaproteobacteria bacterium]
MSAPSDRWFAAILAVLVGVTFLPVVGFDLVYDDHLVLTDNGYLRTRGDLWKLFDGRAVEEGVPDAHRPVSVVWDVVTYRLFGLSAAAHHGLSLFLAAAASVLGFAWLRRRGEPPWTAFVAGAVFSVLAVHAEPVAVVSFREDLLAFVLAVTAACLVERRGTWRPPVASACFFAACQTKMSVAPLALIVPAAQLGGVGRRDPARARTAAAALAFGLAVAVLHRIAVLGAFSGQGDDPRSLAHTHGWDVGVAAGFEAAAMGLGRLLLPVGLAPDHPDRPATWADPAPWLVAAAFALAAGWCLVRSLRGPLPRAAFVAGALALSFVPALGFVPLRNVEAERYLFVPSWIFSIGAAAGLTLVARRLAPRVGVMAAAAPAFALVVVQGAAAQAHARDFRSESRLWEVAARRAPGSARAQSLAAIQQIRRIETYQRAERPVPPWMWARARAGCHSAARLDPHEALADMCQGRLAVAERRWEAAFAAFLRAYDKGLGRADRALAAAAHVALDLGDAQRDEALAQIAQFLANHPYAAGLWAARGRIRHRLGDPDGALSDLRRARRLAPERWDVVIWGLELALDLGDAAAARDLLASVHDDLVERAPAPDRATIWRRIRLARTLGLATSDPRLVHGVFPP